MYLIRFIDANNWNLYAKQENEHSMMTINYLLKGAFYIQISLPFKWPFIYQSAGTVSTHLHTCFIICIELFTTDRCIDSFHIKLKLQLFNLYIKYPRPLPSRSLQNFATCECLTVLKCLFCWIFKICNQIRSFGLLLETSKHHLCSRDVLFGVLQVNPEGVFFPGDTCWQK